MRISSNVYRVIAFNNSTITLSSKYVEESPLDFIPAYYNTPPKSCVDFPNQSSAEDMKRHIEQNFDNSPFNESIAVSRHNFESNNGHGAVYHVTFIGPAFSHDTEELLLVSNLAPWYDKSCGNSFKINGAISSKVSTTVTTAMDSLSLSP